MNAASPLSKHFLFHFQAAAAEQTKGKVDEGGGKEEKERNGCGKWKMRPQSVIINIKNSA